jgi:hypothetical protein
MSSNSATRAPFCSSDRALMAPCNGPGLIHGPTLERRDPRLLRDLCERRVDTGYEGLCALCGKAHRLRVVGKLLEDASRGPLRSDDRLDRRCLEATCTSRSAAGTAAPNTPPKIGVLGAGVLACRRAGWHGEAGTDRTQRAARRSDGPGSATAQGRQVAQRRSRPEAHAEESMSGASRLFVSSVSARVARP